MTYMPLKEKKGTPETWGRSQEKATIATGGIDTGKRDVSNTTTDTFDAWIESNGLIKQWLELGNTKSSHSIMSALKLAFVAGQRSVIETIEKKIE